MVGEGGERRGRREEREKRGEGGERRGRREEREERGEGGDETGMEKNKRKGMMSEVTWEVGLHITALIKPGTS